MTSEHRVTVGEEPRYSDVAALPIATAAYRGQTLRVEGAAGVTDSMYVCLKSAAGTYSWVQFATGG